METAIIYNLSTNDVVMVLRAPTHAELDTMVDEQGIDWDYHGLTYGADHGLTYTDQTVTIERDEEEQ